MKLIKLVGDAGFSSASQVEVKAGRVYVSTDTVLTLGAYSLHRMQISSGHLRVSFMAIFIGVDYPSLDRNTYIFEIKPEIDVFFRDYIKLVIDNY
jgi:hypothetical protein